MRARVDRKALHEALRIVTPAAGGVSYLPVTLGVHIQAVGDVLKLTCTNLDLTVAVEVQADVAQEGVAIPPARLLAQFVASGAGEIVNLQLDAVRLAVSVGDAHMDVACKEISDWPSIPEPNGEPVAFSRSDVDLIGRVIHACHKDTKDPRPGLSSVHFDGDRVEASDRYRMAIGTLGVSGLPSLLVQPATLQSILKAAEGDVVLVADSKLAKFTSGPISWTTTLVVDEFPDLSTFMKRAEDACSRSFTVGREPMAAAIERASLVHDGEIRSITITPELDTLIVSGTSIEVGDVSDRVPFTGEWVDPVRINVVYLREALDAFPDDEFVIRGHDAVKPWAIRTADRRLALLVMPVRV